MPVTFDSSGHGAKLSLSGSGTLTWSHTVSTMAANTVVLVGVLWNGDVDVSSASFSVTYGSTTMTKIAGPVTWLSGIGSNPKSWMALYSLTSPTAGTSTITISYSGMSGSLLTDNLYGVSSSYAGVASVDAAVTATTSTSTDNSVTVPSLNPANRVVTVHGVGITKAFTGAYPASLRAKAALVLGGQLVIGDTPGSSSVTETIEQSNTNQWGAFGVNLEPAVVTATAAAPAIALGAITCRGGVFRSSLPPRSRTWMIDVSAQDVPAAVSKALISSISSANITDAGATGLALLRSSTTTAAWSVLGSAPGGSGGGGGSTVTDRSDGTATA